MLRLKLEQAENKLREQNGTWGKMEDETYTAGPIMPELNVDGTTIINIFCYISDLWTLGCDLHVFLLL